MMLDFTKGELIRIGLWTLAAMVAIAFLLSGQDQTVHYKAEPQTSSTSIEVRDKAIFILRPTDVERYEDWSKYVDIHEGDTISIVVTKP